MNLALQSAALPAGMVAQANPPLTIQQKQQWNAFIDYLEKQGYKGSPDLDNRDTKLGATLIDQYKKINPSFSLNYDNVRDVQQELQDYKAQSIQSIKDGRANLGDQTYKTIIKNNPKYNFENFMTDISPADGWLGSKTSSWRFPSSSVVKERNIQGLTGEDARLNAPTKEVINLGLDAAAYNTAMSKTKPK